MTALRAIALAGALAALAATAGAQDASPAVNVSLSYADAAEQPPAPWRAADVHITNASQALLRQVELTPAGGGPAVLWPAAVPPGQTQTLRLPLPAAAPQQTYNVRLIGDGETASVSADISWPLEAVAPLVDRQALDASQNGRPPWPAELLRNVFLAAAIAAIASAACLLLRTPRLRLAGVLVVAVALSVAMFALLHPRLAGPGVVTLTPAPAGGNRVIVQSRRSTRWTSERPLLPLYVSPPQFRDDESVIQPYSVTTTLHPNRPRVFWK